MRNYRSYSCTRRFQLLTIFLALWHSASGSRMQKNITSAVERQIRSIGFPTGSGMGIFFAIGIPLDIPNKSVTLSFYFEANYFLPNDKNSTIFEEYLEKRNLDRKLAYEICENKFEGAGFPGRTCLLRTICEITKDPFSNNGLVGDLLQLLFTPSTSNDEAIPDEIKKAEYTQNCNIYNKCPISLLDLLSHYILD